MHVQELSTFLTGHAHHNAGAVGGEYRGSPLRRALGEAGFFRSHDRAANDGKHLTSAGEARKGKTDTEGQNCDCGRDPDLVMSTRTHHLRIFKLRLSLR